MATFRADPTGTSYQNPWTPTRQNGLGGNELDVSLRGGQGTESFTFLDPIVATGFVYTQEAGAPGFAELRSRPRFRFADVLPA